ncbi:MAG: hypothetical protein H0T76_14380 [Nannocystis sp.]|nr:hypothetical protein [Nannocystis sp.]MBA3547668.1 hypothetical protein [Nannocystis sp.]
MTAADDRHLTDEGFSAPLSGAQRAHVARCTSCQQRRDNLDALQRALRALPRIAEPPDGALALLEMPARSPPRRRLRGVLGVAAMLAALVATHYGFRGGTEVMDTALAQEIALDHLHYERRIDAAEIRGTREEVVDYFEQTLSMRPHLPEIEATRVLGGKRCRIGGTWTALVWFERADAWLSLFALPSPKVVRRGCVEAAGVNVCGAHDPRGGSRILAGKLPQPEMLRLIDESLE